MKGLTGSVFHIATAFFFSLLERETLSYDVKVLLLCRLAVS